MESIDWRSKVGKPGTRGAVAASACKLLLYEHRTGLPGTWNLVLELCAVQTHIHECDKAPSTTLSWVGSLGTLVVSLVHLW